MRKQTREEGRTSATVGAGRPPGLQSADELQDLFVGAAAQVFGRRLVGELFRFEAAAAPAVQGALRPGAGDDARAEALAEQLV